MKIVQGNTKSILRFQWSSVVKTSMASAALNQEGASSSLASSTSAACPDGAHCSRLRKDEKEQHPCNRYQHAACCVGDYVYVFGGKDRYSPLKDFWRLHVVSGQWESLAGWSIDLPHLQCHTMTPYKSQIFIFGGSFCDPLSEETPLWILNTDLGILRKYRSNHPGCARPSGRREHSCVLHRNSLYLYGGFLDSSGSSDEFWAFSIEEEDWRLIKRHKPGKRHGHVAVTLGSHMWLHGGMKGLRPLSDLWTFNFSMCTWDSVKSLGVSPSLSNHTAHVVNGCLMLFGGYRNSAMSNDVWIFQFDTVTWRQVTRQQGDLCPPISLHASVVLSQSENSVAWSDRSQSVPQLRRQTQNNTPRPWTSPSQDSGVAENQGDLGLRPLVSERISRDILHLHDFQEISPGVVIDKNNNASQEDLTSEAETSFFHDSSPPQAYLTQKVESQSSKVRPGGQEYCDDGLPLLKRFQSVQSGVDMGEHNTMLSLSDERLESEFVGCAQSIYRNAHNEESNNIARKSNTTLLQQATDFISQVERETSTTKMAVSRGRSCSFVNPLFNNYGPRLSHGDDFHQLDVLFHPQGNRSSGSFSDVYGEENVPPVHEDMILEDIENSDFANLFHNVKVTIPSTFSVSVDELNKHDKITSCKRFTGSHPQLNRLVLHSSSDTVNSSPMNEARKRKSVESLLEKRYMKNMNVSSQDVSKVAHFSVKPKHKDFKKTINTDKTVGRYTKNTTGQTKQAALAKSRAKCFSSSHIDRVVSTHSTGTQTTGSQLCLQDAPTVTGEQVVKSNTTGSLAQLSDPVRKQTTTVKSRDSPTNQGRFFVVTDEQSIVSGCQVCLLVIGGQTQNPSFISEPLKLWRCCLL